MSVENKKVKVYYCQCGRSVEMVYALEVDRSRSAKSEMTREITQAVNFGRKVEEMTVAEFRLLPFLCDGVAECPVIKNQNSEPDPERSVANQVK